MIGCPACTHCCDWLPCLHTHCPLLKYNHTAGPTQIRTHTIAPFSRTVWFSGWPLTTPWTPFVVRMVPSTC